MSHLGTIRTLRDIREHCQYIIDDTAGLTYELFLSSRVVRQAVERNLIIIGIAAMRLRDDDPDTFDGLEDLRLAIGVRNRLAHGYDDQISEQAIWSIVTSGIPNLMNEIEGKLQPTRMVLFRMRPFACTGDIVDTLPATVG